MTNTDTIFTPFTLANGVEVKNRLFMAPMTIQDSNENGMVSDHEIEYYAKRAGEIGTIITAATYVDFLGKAFLSGPGASEDYHIPGLHKLASAIQGKGSKAILQLVHGGRMVPTANIHGQQPVSASAVAPLREGADTPRALEVDEITHIIDSYKEATRRAIIAGFDGVEIHGANTYLIQQFFSPHSNHRKDEWGGTLEKRAKFPLAIIDAVKEAVDEYSEKPFIIGYRISPEEMEEPGIKLDDTLFLLDYIIDKHVDYIHISLNEYNRKSIREDENYDGLINEKIVAHVNNRVPLMGVGAVTSSEDVDHIQDLGMPLVAIGRQLITEPNFVEKLKTKDYATIRHNISYHDKDALGISDAMWAYFAGRPGWLPISEDYYQNLDKYPYL